MASSFCLLINWRRWCGVCLKLSVMIDFDATFAATVSSCLSVICYHWVNGLHCCVRAFVLRRLTKQVYAVFDFFSSSRYAHSLTCSTTTSDAKLGVCVTYEILSSHISHNYEWIIYAVAGFNLVICVNLQLQQQVRGVCQHINYLGMYLKDAKCSHSVDCFRRHHFLSRHTSHLTSRLCYSVTRRYTTL